MRAFQEFTGRDIKEGAAAPFSRAHVGKRFQFCPHNENRKTNAREKKVIIDFDMLRKVSGRNFRDLGGHPTVKAARSAAG